MVYVTTLSWHIAYSMKLWLQYANEGFDGGLVKICKRWGLDYMNVGKNHVDGGRHGGAFMAPWGMGKMIPKLSSGHCWDSFDSIVGCLHRLVLGFSHYVG